MMFAQGKYIYGIIAESQPTLFKFLGLEEAPVYTINHQDIAAVISNTNCRELYPTRKNVQAHTIIQDEVLKDYTLLPMGFGTIADSPFAVRNILEKNYQGLHGELNRLSGKVQVELKVFWDQEAMVGELQQNNQDINRLKSRIATVVSPVETQSLMIKAGKMVEGVTREWKKKYAEPAYNALKNLAHDAQLNNPTGINNLLNASFLVDRTKESEFKSEVYKLDDMLGGKVNFKYIGPLPPYNFVGVKLEPTR